MAKQSLKSIVTRGENVFWYRTSSTKKLCTSTWIIHPFCISATLKFHIVDCQSSTTLRLHISTTCYWYGHKQVTMKQVRRTILQCISHVNAIHMVLACISLHPQSSTAESPPLLTGELEPLSCFNSGTANAW